MAAREFNLNSETLQRDPPRDLTAERSLLGAIMLDGSILTRISEELGLRLAPEDFASERHRVIYEAILKRSAFADDFYPTVLCDQIENDGLLEKAGGRAYITGLTSLTEPIAVAVQYAVIVHTKARRRRLIAAAESIIENSYNPQGRTVDELYDEAQGIIFKLSEESSLNESGPREAVPIAVELLNKIRDEMGMSRMTGIPTGFTELDELTSGLQPGSLNIIAARPGIGKTSFAMNIVENIAMNPDIHKPALVFSLEMPATQIVMRMLCTFGRVSIKDLSEGRVQQNQWHDIIRKISLLIDRSQEKKFNKLFIDDSGDLTPLELRSRARKLAMDYGGLSIIMVDYIQLMRSQSRFENRSLEVGEISRSLKLLAKELEIPIIALSQLNREVEGRRDHRPMNSDLRESGSLEQDADMIMFLHRASVYRTSAEEGNIDDGRADLIIGKNRNGATRDIELQFQGAYTAFYDKANPLAFDDNNIPQPDFNMLQ